MKGSILPISLILTVLLSVILTFSADRSFGQKAGQTSPQQKKEVASATKVIYTCPMHPKVIQDKPGKCPECRMDLVKKEVPRTTYTCPMHPKVVQDKPGKCPDCGMALVEKIPAKKNQPKKN